MGQRVLVVQTDTASAAPLVRFFKDRGDEVWEAWELGQAEALAAQTRPDLMVFDLHVQEEGWLTFLRGMRHRYPNLKIIASNKTPDLQREIQAQSAGVRVFLRQPFRARWIAAALEKLDKPEDSVPVPRSRPAAELPKVRTPVRYKITLPYLVLSLVLALATAFVASQVIFETVQDRFYNQLVVTGQQTSDWMVREESRLLESLRLMANTQGVAEALQAGDAEGLRSLLLPLAVNANEDAVEVLDSRTATVLSLRRTPGDPSGVYQSERGDPFFQSVDFALAVSVGLVDEQGDKYAGVVQAPWGNYFYVAGPVFNAQGEQAGTLLVGSSLYSMVRRMSIETLGETTLYDLNGNPLASTLFVGDTAINVGAGQVGAVLASQDRDSLTRSLTVDSVSYTELLGPWEARAGQDLGLMGVSMGQAFLATTSRATRYQIFGLIAVSLFLIVGVGVLLADRITGPLQRLMKASTEVARGNLRVKVDTSGNDEVAVLAHSFNYMIAGLQEGSIYRDLLGRTVSPEVREQLRQTFTSGNLHLEGQHAVASVLMTDVRGFTTLSEKTDPATVFRWLNEYFERMVPLVVRSGGVVNKFDGDAMLAFFGILPRMLSPKESAYTACRTALDILGAINQFNEERAARGEPPLITGIGVNTGEVIAGGLGARDRIHYTIIGDTVNTAQRLEGLTRQIFKDNGILISHATYEALEEYQDEFFCEPLGLRSVKGKAERILVYRLQPVRQLPNLDVML
jgi:adenylate cyclase